jgi:hypothetical protein
LDQSIFVPPIPEVVEEADIIYRDPLGFQQAHSVA